MIFLDIETNLKHDTIWLCVTKHNTTGEVRHWREADSLQQYLEGEQVVGHNIIGFDAGTIFNDENFKIFIILLSQTR